MAIVHGDIIKIERKKRKMSQNDLAEGICKQATISNIERKNFCKDIEILSKICRKLNLTLGQVVQSSPEDWLEEKLTSIEDLLSKREYEKADKALKQIKMNHIQEEKIINRYYYNSGKSLLLGKKDTDGALFYFNQVLSTASENDLYGILANTGVGVTYQEKGQLNFAQIYFTKALTGITHTNQQYPLIFNEVLYKVAGFYRETKEYQKAIDLCKKAIEINQNYQSTFFLEYLVQEIGRNKEALNDKNASSFFADALKIANFNKNNHFTKEI